MGNKKFYWTIHKSQGRSDYPMFKSQRNKRQENIHCVESMNLPLQQQMYQVNKKEIVEQVDCKQLNKVSNVVKSVEDALNFSIID